MREFVNSLFYTFLNNLCSASNKIKSRYDHSDLIHFLLYQSKGSFFLIRNWGQFWVFSNEILWELYLQQFKNVKRASSEFYLLNKFGGQINTILMDRRKSVN